jgi:hypothetical protein
MNGLSSSMDTSQYTGTNGIYVGAELHPEYGLKLQPIAEQLKCPDLDLDELHCTLVYSREKAPERLPMLPGFMKGLVTSVQHWVGHNDKVYVVADVHCSPMIDAHARLLRVGAEHSFVGYKPHITLGSFEPGTQPENLDELCENVNRALQRDPMMVLFHQIKAKDIKKD